MRVTLRRASEADYPALSELFDEVDALHREHLPQLFKQPDGAPRERSYYLGLLADERVGFWVAEADEQLAGFVYVIIMEAGDLPILAPRRFAFIETLVVKAAFRRQGIGEKLMNCSDEWAIANGASAIELNVYEFNKNALVFYEKLGYAGLSRQMIKKLPGKEEVVQGKAASNSL
jgi:diamine N-acetyltransferase